MMQDDWKFGHAGHIGYLDAIAALGDLRKVNGASESVLRGLSSMKMYLKRVRKTVSKMMRLQWTSKLDIDDFEAKSHWATLEELLEVVGHYLPRYEDVLNSCKDTPGTVSPLDLSFATNFLAVHLFIKVKGSCPVTYMYLTVEMVNRAKTNGGFINQKMFKTAGKYGFDSLFLTDTSMQVLDGYINHIRPLLKLTCDYVLVTRNGGQQNKLGELMSKLVLLPCAQTMQCLYAVPAICDVSVSLWICYKNVGNFLVRSTFKTIEKPGTFKCARLRCKTCPFLQNADKVSGPK